MTGSSSAADERGRGDRADPAITLRACSFNIRYDNPSEDYLWDERADRVIEAVSEIDPDLIGMQEALSNQYDQLRDTLDAYEWYGVGRDDGEREGEMVPVAWRKDAFELVEKGAFWLSETPSEPSIGWDADLPRVATWASLRHRETGERVWFCNTHLSHVSTTARTEAATLLCERAQRRAEAGETIVVTGDFNSKPDREPYEIMTGIADDSESRLFDPRREAGTRSVRGPWGTFHGFTGDVMDRIDYVFVSDTATVTRYRTLDVREDGYRSDHLPIVAEFEC